MRRKMAAIILLSFFLLSLMGCGNNQDKNLETEDLETGEDTKTSFYIGDFRTKTLNEEEVTVDFIKNNRLTMVNIWATWCGPCVEEMPDLANLEEILSEKEEYEGVKILSLCTDGLEEGEIAKAIIEDAKADFQVIIPDEILADGLLRLIDAYPTTLFFDSQGNLVGDRIVGAPREKVEEYYLNGIDRALKLIGE